MSCLQPEALRWGGEGAPSLFLDIAPDGAYNQNGLYAHENSCMAAKGKSPKPCGKGL